MKCFFSFLVVVFFFIYAIVSNNFSVLSSYSESVPCYRKGDPSIGLYSYFLEKAGACGKAQKKKHSNNADLPRFLFGLIFSLPGYLKFPHKQDMRAKMDFRETTLLCTLSTYLLSKRDLSRPDKKNVNEFASRKVTFFTALPT